MATPAGSNAYEYRISKMKDTFLALAEETTGEAKDEWVLVASLQNPKLSVYKLANTDFCIKVVADLNCTPETAFDMLSDITRRGEWDDLCEETGIVEVIDKSTKVQFLKTKGVWPASPRDTLVLAHVERLADGRYLNVAQSVEHARFPPRELEGIVRMEAKISGQVVGPTLDNRPGMCRVVQVADGDLKGWIPKSVIGFIATKSMPNSFKKLDGILKEAEQQSESVVIARAEAEEDEFGPDSADLTSPTAILASLPVTTFTSPSVAQQRRYPAARRLVRRLRAVLDWWNPFLVTLFLFLKAYQGARKRLAA
ncbi:hypothetical protein HKX48_007686 [Thoreauomyces humboldtii]|nr:hypothetical protein HKX48_007686 [Thoreauomyces humboldtii]